MSIQQKTVSGKRKLFTASCIAIIIIFILLLPVLLVVELTPVKSVPATSDSMAIATISSKTFALLGQLEDKRNKVCSVNFSGQEINALLVMLMQYYASEKNPTDPLLYLQWQENFCRIDSSIKFAGIYLNFYLQIIPSIDSGKIYLQIISCHLGKLPLPAKIAEKILNKELSEKLAKERKLQKYLPCIHSLQAQKSGGIELQLLRKSAEKILKSFF